MNKLPPEEISERDIAICAIEAYLTADKKTHRQPKATQILVALERLGYQLAKQKANDVCPECGGKGEYAKSTSSIPEDCPSCNGTGKKARPDRAELREKIEEIIGSIYHAAYDVKYEPIAISASINLIADQLLELPDSYPK